MKIYGTAGQRGICRPRGASKQSLEQYFQSTHYLRGALKGSDELIYREHGIFIKYFASVSSNLTSAMI